MTTFTKKFFIGIDTTNICELFLEPLLVRTSSLGHRPPDTGFGLLHSTTSDSKFFCHRSLHLTIFRQYGLSPQFFWLLCKDQHLVFRSSKTTKSRDLVHCTDSSLSHPHKTFPSDGRRLISESLLSVATSWVGTYRTSLDRLIVLLPPEWAFVPSQGWSLYDNVLDPGFSFIY